MTNYIDLHTHSTASDGIYSPTKLMELAHEAGLRIIALTDHDSTEGLTEAFLAANQLGIELIPGIEINTNVGKDEIHVLGYYPEYQRPEFQAILNVLREGRLHRGQRIVELLNKQGIHISWERVQEIAKGAAVGRPHIAKALVEAKYAKSNNDAFARYLSPGCPAYVGHHKLSPMEAIRFIRSANGLPVMAHPLTIPGLEQLRKWLPELVATGLIGLETYYGPYTQQQEQELHQLANSYNLIPTGGSDYHGPNIHPTPLGGRFVPAEAVALLKAASAKLAGTTPPPFELPEDEQ